MSATTLDECNFVIFDCEGLFSVHRQSQEEIKLCLFLTAISDVLILNSDLTSNRYLQNLFEQFKRGMVGLRGKFLFKGLLDIAIRDVGYGQDQDALSECYSFLEGLKAQGKSDCISKLFDGRVVAMSYVNFENSDFENDVDFRREFYMNKIEPRWKNGEDLILEIKTILAQIFADDVRSSDSRTFDFKLEEANSKFTKLLSDHQNIKNILGRKPYRFEISINHNNYGINADVFGILLDESDKIKTFNNVFKDNLPNELEYLHHND